MEFGSIKQKYQTNPMTIEVTTTIQVIKIVGQKQLTYKIRFFKFPV